MMNDPPVWLICSHCGHGFWSVSKGKRVSCGKCHGKFKNPNYEAEEK